MSVAKLEDRVYAISDRDVVMFEPNRAEVLKSYENQWVALTHERDGVVASGSTLKEAAEKAQEKNYSDPIFTFV